MNPTYCKHGHTKSAHPRCFERGKEPSAPKAAIAPKVLIFDVESSPIIVFAWRLGEQRLYPHQIIHDRFLISWSAKWLFDNKVMSGVLTPEEARARDDRRIAGDMWSLLDEADIVIAHNGKRFDLPLLHSRFIIHNMKPPMYYQVIDTLAVVRRVFGFSSNSLNYINLLLDIDGKKDTDFQLWVDCYAGDKSALRRMVKYNEHDVVILEELYVRIRPWIKSHPNMGLYVESWVEVCPTCGSDNLHWRGMYFTPAGRYEAFRCKKCGTIGRKLTNDLDKEEKKVLVRN